MKQVARASSQFQYLLRRESMHDKLQLHIFFFCSSSLSVRQSLFLSSPCLLPPSPSRRLSLAQWTMRSPAHNVCTTANKVETCRVWYRDMAPLMPSYMLREYQDSRDQCLAMTRTNIMTGTSLCTHLPPDLKKPVIPYAAALNACNSAAASYFRQLRVVYGDPNEFQ